MQGTFKRRLNLDDLWTGQKLAQPLQNVPPKWLIEPFLALAKRVSPGVQIGSFSQPCMLTPLATTSQCIHVSTSHAGVPEIGIETEPLEDIRILSPQCCDKTTGA